MQSVSTRVAERESFHGNTIAWEFWIRFLPAVQLTLLYRRTRDAQNSRVMQVSYTAKLP
jgi:hypothetical protein